MGKEGCVLHLPFDEGEGAVAYDKSGESNNGAITGATFVDGKWSKALNFNGVSDTVHILDSNSLDVQEATFSAWIKTSGKEAGVTNPHILRKTLYYFLIIEGATGYAWLRIYSGSTAKDVKGTTNLFDGLDHHVAGVYNGADLKIYVDGVLQNTTTPVTGFANAKQYALDVGSNVATDEWFKGIIDEVRIYNRALTQKEITRLYLQNKLFMFGRAGRKSGR